MSGVGRRHRDSRGQSLVEFALLLPVFILVLLGIVDLGRAVYAYSTINNAAREGGRQAIVDQTEAHIQDRAVQHAVGLEIDASDIYVDFRYPTTAEDEDSCDDDLGDNEVVGCLAVVRVSYQFQAATPIIGNIIGPIDMAGETRFRVEFNCLEPNKPTCPIAE